MMTNELKELRIKEFFHYLKLARYIIPIIVQIFTLISMTHPILDDIIEKEDEILELLNRIELLEQLQESFQ